MSGLCHRECVNDKRTPFDNGRLCYGDPSSDLNGDVLAWEYDNGLDIYDGGAGTMKERGILMKPEMSIATINDWKTQTRRVIKNEFLIEELDFLGDVRIEYVEGLDRLNDNGKIHQYTGLLASCAEYPEEGWIEVKCPYGVPGDRLWVRETWAIRDYGSKVSLSIRAWPTGFPKNRVEYFAHMPDEYAWNKRPSIFMPQWASRTTLEITNIRAERVQALDVRDEHGQMIGKDAWAEGLRCTNATAAFMILWDQINGKPTPAKFVNKKPTIYFSAPWSKESRDPRTEINGLPHICWPNPWVWVVEFRRIK